MGPTTIVLADDHPVFRVGLRTLLEKEQDFRVIGEAFNGIEAVRLAHRLNPDVLILDLMMPGMNGLYVTSEVKQYSPRTRVIILSMHAHEFYVRETFKRGADGYVLKDTLADEIVQAVRTVISGTRHFGELLSEFEAAALLQQPNGQPGDSYETLTSREREIFYLVAKGRKNREIAHLLGISIRTAETHRARVMHKLKLRNQTDLIQYALQKKLLPPP